MKQKCTKYIRGCTVKLLLSLEEFREKYSNKITFAKILDVDLIHFNKPSLKMFVSVVYISGYSNGNAACRYLSKYIFNYSLNGSEPIEVEVDGLAYKIYGRSSSYEEDEDYYEAIYDDAIRAAIDLIDKIKESALWVIIEYNEIDDVPIKIEHLENLIDVYELVGNNNTITIAKITNEKLIQFTQPTIIIYVSLICENYNVTHYQLDYSFNGVVSSKNESLKYGYHYSIDDLDVPYYEALKQAKWLLLNLTKS